MINYSLWRRYQFILFPQFLNEKPTALLMMQQLGFGDTFYLNMFLIVKQRAGL